MGHPRYGIPKTTKRAAQTNVESLTGRARWHAREQTTTTAHENSQAGIVRRVQGDAHMGIDPKMTAVL